ncbi:hypothetical protein ACWC9U_28640 [Streptomyces sp. 900116325]
MAGHSAPCGAARSEHAWARRAHRAGAIAWLIATRRRCLRFRAPVSLGHLEENLAVNDLGRGGEDLSELRG